LDLRGDKDLEPADINEFDCFLFGGILGDHPPRDRSKPMRDKGYKMKRLGEV
jgi:ribosome biogenesis SPOUT family RNA methylase Rps3